MRLIVDPSLESTKQVLRLIVDPFSSILSLLSILHNSLESTKHKCETHGRSILIYTILVFYLTFHNFFESTKQVCETHSVSILIYTMPPYYLTLHNPLESMKQVRETLWRSILIYTILASQIFLINETSM